MMHAGNVHTVTVGTDPCVTLLVGLVGRIQEQSRCNWRMHTINPSIKFLQIMTNQPMRTYETLIAAGLQNTMY